MNSGRADKSKECLTRSQVTCDEMCVYATYKVKHFTFWNLSVTIIAYKIRVLTFNITSNDMIFELSVWKIIVLGTLIEVQANYVKVSWILEAACIYYNFQTLHNTLWNFIFTKPLILCQFFHQHVWCTRSFK